MNISIEDRIDEIKINMDRWRHSSQHLGSYYLKINIPDFIVPDLREFIRVSLECCDLVFRQVEAYFQKTEDIKPLVSTIDSHESRCDHMEREIVSKIFDADMDSFEKLQLKELVGQMGEIADQADRVSRSVYIINIKRRV